MREVKFRGIRKDCGQWETGNYSTYISYGGEKRHFINGPEYPVHGWSVGEWSGIDDKNGVPIFEGDIVQAKIEGGAYMGFTWPPMVVVFDHGSFCLQSAKGERIPLTAYSPRATFEVRGNIYDNSGLLSGKFEEVNHERV